MQLTEILRPEMVWPELKSTTKQDIIKELADKIANCEDSLKADVITGILLERERLGSTGIQDGIAIPHGKVPGLDHIIIACGRSMQGIEFEAHDAKPTHLFFVLLAPEFAAGQHLKALARLSRLLKDSSFRDKLLNAVDSKEMYNTITFEDKNI